MKDAECALARLVAAVDAASPVCVRAAAEDVRAVNALRTLRDAPALRTLEKRIAAALNMPAARGSAAWDAGATAAALLLDECGWRIAEAHGKAWIDRAHANMEQAAKHNTDRPAAVADCLPLARLAVTQLMGRESLAHPEYHRVVVAPQIAPMAAATLALVGCAQEWAASHAPGSPALPALLVLVAEQLRLYASTYRPHAARLHALCMEVLFAAYKTASGAASARPPPRALSRAATVLLATLPLTGAVAGGGGGGGEHANLYGQSGRVQQTQLWAATAGALVAAAEDAFCASVPSVDWRALGVDAAADDALGWEPLAAGDYMETVAAALERVRLLVGDATHAGVLPQYLSCAMPRAVPVPVGALVRLAAAALQVRVARTADVPLDLARAEEGARLRVCAYGMHLLAFTALVAQQATWQFVFAPRGALLHLCVVAENSVVGSTERVLSLRTLGLLLGGGGVLCDGSPVPSSTALPLPPTAPFVLRMSRMSVQQTSAFLVHAPRAWEDDVRPVKKARMFESDAVALAERAPQDGVLAKTAVETEACDASVRLFSALFPTLACSPAAGSAELARTGLLAVLGVAEALLCARLLSPRHRAGVALAVTCMNAVADLIVRFTGKLTAEILPRFHALVMTGVHASVPPVRAACRGVEARIAAVLRPRVPPLVDSVNSEAFGAEAEPAPQRAWRAGTVLEAELGVMGAAAGRGALQHDAGMHGEDGSEGSAGEGDAWAEERLRDAEPVMPPATSAARADSEPAGAAEDASRDAQRVTSPGDEETAVRRGTKETPISPPLHASHATPGAGDRQAALPQPAQPSPPAVDRTPDAAACALQPTSRTATRSPSPASSEEMPVLDAASDDE
ncbi:hypothetical protein MSPP1_001206 [Malassezia sp. CBS 17886]|nr:hypothetical protein MSPP1_001206 [Malassezia sp. CBS 17886]